MHTKENWFVFFCLMAYRMIAASILEYMFISVTCCDEIAKKLCEHFSQLFWRLRPHHCVRCPHHCLANSRTVHVRAVRFPVLSRTKPIFQDFPGPGNFINPIPGLYGHFCYATWLKTANKKNILGVSVPPLLLRDEAKNNYQEEHFGGICTATSATRRG